MTEHDERDDLFRALAQLPVHDLAPAQSRAVLARATQTLASRRGGLRLRVAGLAALWTHVLQPVAVGALSLGFIGAALGQAIFVLSHVHDGFLWR